MLKLFWTPATGGGVPADVAWQAKADSLRADSATTVPVQNIIRKEPGVAQPTAALMTRLDTWLAHRDPTVPVTLLAHGFSYDPAVSSQSDPFNIIYAYPGPDHPAQLSFLPLVGECDEQGGARRDTTIAFGWLSSGTINDYGGACWNNSYQLAVLDLAPLAATAFATVIAALSTRKVKVRILAHSLGTRLVGQAVGLLRDAKLATTIERIVLLGGAEFGVDAFAAYDGCGFDVINLGSQQDTVLRFGQIACHPVRESGSAVAAVIGRNGLGGNGRWFDLQLNASAVVQWAGSGRGPTGAKYHVNALPEDNVHPEANLAHWAYYTNRGNRAFVRDLLLDSSMSVDKLRAAAAPDGFQNGMYGNFAGHDVPRTPTTCAERRGDILIAGGSFPTSG